MVINGFSFLAGDDGDDGEEGGANSCFFNSVVLNSFGTFKLIFPSASGATGGEEGRVFVLR